MWKRKLCLNTFIFMDVEGNERKDKEGGMKSGKMSEAFICSVRDGGVS